jgi:hypothetical protein
MFAGRSIFDQPKRAMDHTDTRASLIDLLDWFSPDTGDQ